jgi:uncharacterized membrane protein YcaP (DUF421 family)
METLFSIDWKGAFVPTASILEIVGRGSLMYLVIFALMRFVLKREAGGIGLADLLVVVLIADAAQNAMAGEYKSITEGIALVATLVFWDFTLDWLGYQFPRLERLLHPPPLPLIENGRMLRRNMRRELIGEQELMSYLRGQGVEDVAEVKKAYMEGDGRISVISRGSEKERGTRSNKKSMT